ncbi:hypothetical protein PM082_007408 [Marasmius tenuissimus]|nr:hypothetical protein PM082_007408 [Marasmius tenuissimus]
MVSYKAFITLAFAAVALAAPNARRQAAGEPANCSYVLTPSTTVGDDVNLVSEFNFAIGRTIAIESPSHDSIGGSGFTGVDNGDGTFTATGSIGTSAWTADELKAVVTAWPGRSLQGFSIPEWEVESVTCD